MVQGKCKWNKYVVQKHLAKNLHYDFRLEYDGVLKSWAVPKGPSFDPADRRLAIEVDDHSIEHLNYESDNVTIWDQGEYRNITGLEQENNIIPFAEAYNNGVIELELKGEQLNGKWVFVKMNSYESKKNWLLIKKKKE